MFTGLIEKVADSCALNSGQIYLLKHSKMTLESQSNMCLVISVFGNETIICQLADWIIPLSTYERVNLITVNGK